MDQKTIIIYVDKKTTREEIKEIRQLIKEKNRNCKINIFVSGSNDFKSNLSEFIKARAI